jgi:hypothetical protein
MMQIHYDGYLRTAAWEHEFVQARRAALRKHFLGYIAGLEAMRRDLRAMGHDAHELARELRDRLIEECGWRGKLSALVAGPLVTAALRAERGRVSRSKRRRRSAEPRCLLTHYGSFDHRTSRILPRPGVTPGSVAIRRPGPVRSRGGRRTEARGMSAPPWTQTHAASPPAGGPTRSAEVAGG